MKKEAKIDVAVLLLFFVRTKLTIQVFEQIRLARPSKLFLYQDGPRPDRDDDVRNIAECRQLIEDKIDWDCEVHRMYQEKNYGCDPSEYISQKWMFSIVEKGIVLEDDDVPSQSFFPFCKELLDKYEFDERINMICGMNNLGTYDCPDDYFFARSGSIWGWASWRRVIDSWDDSYAFLEDPWALKLLKCSLGDEYDSVLKTWSNHHKTGRAHYESILGSNCHLNGRINIVPTKNMISNIGISHESTHSVASVDLLPRGIRPVFNIKTNELQFPLKHPKYIVDNTDFIKKMSCSYFTIMCRKIEGRIYRYFPFLGRL